MTIGEIAAIASLLLNISIVAISATWGIAWAIGKINVSVAKAFSEHRQDFENKIETVERRFGEGLVALREKINLDAAALTKALHEIEVMSLTTFARRDSVTDYYSRIDKRLEKMDEKLDKLQERG